MLQKPGRTGTTKWLELKSCPHFMVYTEVSSFQGVEMEEFYCT